MPMLAYVASQGLVYVCVLLFCTRNPFLTKYRLALGLYKCSTMGILPTGSGDWLQFETRLEVSQPIIVVDIDR